MSEATAEAKTASGDAPVCLNEVNWLRKTQKYDANFFRNLLNNSCYILSLLEHR